MPVADPTFAWQEALLAFAMIAVLSFLVTWGVTSVGRVSRAPYVAVLALMTFALGAGYVMWSGTSVTELVTSGWMAGILAGALAALAVAPGVRRFRKGIRPEGSRLVERLIWEGGVYGVAEGLLLATLPVLAIWQACDDVGWTGGGWEAIASGVLAIGGASFVIVVHHLGYREFRGHAARRKLAGALVGCGVQALAFLLTGNILAPIVAHVLLHAQMILRGVELPPTADLRTGISDSRPRVDVPSEETLAA